MATNSFDTAAGGLNNTKAQALKAMALSGTRGMQTFTDAQNQINAQGQQALALAQNGTPANPPAGTDAIIRDRVLGPTQQRQQAITQAGSLFQSDLDRARANTENYTTQAAAQIPVQRQAYENQRGLAAQAWDQYMQLQAEKQALAASGGGGGGGGGGTAAAKPLAVGAATNLLQGAAGQARNADTQALIDSANQLLAGPGSAQQYETDIANQYYDMPLTYPTQGVQPAQGDYETDYANQLYALQGGAPLSSAPQLDDARTHAQAYNYLQALNANQAQPGYGPPAPSNAAVDQAMGQLRAGTLGSTIPNVLAQVTPEQQARQSAITQREQQVGNLVNQLIGPQSRQGPTSSPAYSPYNPFTPTLGGAARETQGASLNDYLYPALQSAADQGYDLGVYNDPTIAGGINLDSGAFNPFKDANDKAQAQQQALSDAGKQAALSQFFGTTDPFELSQASTLYGLQNSQAAADRGVASGVRAQDSADTRTAAGAATASEQQKVDDVVNEALPFVADGSVDPATAKANIYSHLVEVGLSPTAAAQAVAKIASQLDAIAPA